MITEEHLIWDNESWNRIVETIVQFNLSVDLHISSDTSGNNQMSDEVIATRICSISRYIWRACFHNYDEYSNYIFKTFELNPNTWKNVFCRFLGSYRKWKSVPEYFFFLFFLKKLIFFII